eukprot:s2217_g1.t1
MDGNLELAVEPSPTDPPAQSRAMSAQRGPESMTVPVPMDAIVLNRLARSLAGEKAEWKDHGSPSKDH